MKIFRKDITAQSFSREYRNIIRRLNKWRYLVSMPAPEVLKVKRGNSSRPLLMGHALKALLSN